MSSPPRATGALAVEVDELRGWVLRLLATLEVSDRAAQTTADSMLHANRRGLDSHGVVYLGVYARRLREGIIRGDAEPEIVHDLGALAVLDAHRAPGAYAARIAIEWCCETARRQGVGAVAVRNSNHFGAASFFSELAARRGCIGVALTNSDPGMAPLGALAPVLGTNPIAIAAPAAATGAAPATGATPGSDGGAGAGAGASIMPSLDIATSVVAQGRVAAAARSGVPIPPGWGIGLDGAGTTDAEKAMSNSVLPMGGHKGFGLAFMIDVLTSCFTGAEISPELVEEEGAGHFMLALDVDAATSLERYDRRLGALIDAVHAAPRADGVPRFLIPGEREVSTARERAQFIPIDGPTRVMLDGLSSECGVPELVGEERSR
ncbi:MAG TPA: Ldh family oxidoreductase [Solirubrobacteraceae bacterium]|nr:Ldh family oxidoreductase [Solirubrobacteraceae bacterium]